MKNTEQETSDATLASQSNSVNSDTSSESFTPATQLQKTLLAGVLVIAAVILVYVWLETIADIEKDLHKETRVSWVAAADTSLLSGPPAFYLDRDKKELVFVGQIDKETKKQLVELLDTKDELKKIIAPSYMAAIDQLAFRSNESLYGMMLSLLWVGGLSGVVGVHLRSLINFVGNTCFSEKLDVKRWWPWYVIRPISGFIIGALVVLLFHTGLLATSITASGGTLWWVAIAVLAGFGADEFTQRLRLLTQTLFGQSK